jgi:hypothetical protein
MYIGKCDFKWAMENPGGSDECGCFVGMGVGKGRVCPHQGFFFLGQLFLSEGTAIFGYRKILKISEIYRTR